MMSRFVFFFACTAALGAGCSVQVRDGQFGCTDGRCPTGWYCHSDDVCYATPEGAPDASMDVPAPRDAGDAGSDAGTDAPIDAPAFLCAVSDGSPCTRGAEPGLCCGGRCIDPSSDAANCGTCGNDCTATGDTQRCLDGTCVECLPGLDRCNDSLPCTTDECNASGACVHTPTCPPLVPMMQDCRSGVVCTVSGCQLTYLDDNAMCLNPVSPARDVCAGGVCFDANICGTSVPDCCSSTEPECRVTGRCDSNC